MCVCGPDPLTGGPLGPGLSMTRTRAAAGVLCGPRPTHCWSTRTRARAGVLCGPSVVWT